MYRDGFYEQKYKPLISVKMYYKNKFISGSDNNNAKLEAKERYILASKATQLVDSRQIVIQMTFFF
jgi:hypothetical protein